MPSKKKRKPYKYTDIFMCFVREYNDWRKQFSFPLMVKTPGMHGLFLQARRSADAHEERWPTWDELSAGVMEGPVGDGYRLSTAIGLFLPKGEGEDKTILKMARWGKKAEASDTRQGYIPSGEDSVI